MSEKLMSAIFLDFDNLYSSLSRSLGRQAAHIFGGYSIKWLPDFGAFINEIDGAERKFVVRRCYINPDMYSNYRPYLVRAGFEVVDCPSLTSQHKNSADIYCVMDILDTLKDYPHVQEYIILSADADFTPVVTRLRKHGKQTVIYAPGATAGAYRAASDVQLSEDDFREILSTRVPEQVSAATPSAPQPSAVRMAAPSSSAPAGPTRLGPEALKKLAETLMREIELSGHAPLHFAAAANTVRSILGPEQSTTYGGYGTFIALLSALPLTDVRLDRDAKAILPLSGPASSASDPAPASHPESEEHQDDRPASPLIALVRRISGLVDVPVFPPAWYETVFDTLIEEIRESGFGVARTPKGVSERILRTHGWTAPTQDIAFLMRIMAMADDQDRKFYFSPEVEPSALAARLRQQVTWLCHRNGLDLSEPDRALLQHWIRARGEDHPDLGDPDARAEDVSDDARPSHEHEQPLDQPRFPDFEPDEPQPETPLPQPFSSIETAPESSASEDQRALPITGGSGLHASDSNVDEPTLGLPPIPEEGGQPIRTSAWPAKDTEGEPRTSAPAAEADRPQDRLVEGDDRASPQ